MMGEKRFKLKENLEDVLIEDTITQSQYSIYGIVDLLNEQQATISALKDIFKDIIAYSKWDSEKPYCSLGIIVDKKTYYIIRKILNE